MGLRGVFVMDSEIWATARLLKGGGDSFLWAAC